MEALQASDMGSIPVTRSISSRKSPRILNPSGLSRIPLTTLLLVVGLFEKAEIPDYHQLSVGFSST
jgi:hypothetical protein